MHAPLVRLACDQEETILEDTELEHPWKISSMRVRVSPAGPDQAQGPRLVVRALGLNVRCRLVPVPDDVRYVIEILLRRGALAAGAAWEGLGPVVAADQDAHRDVFIDRGIACEERRDLAGELVCHDGAGLVVRQELAVGLACLRRQRAVQAGQHYHSGCCQELLHGENSPALASRLQQSKKCTRCINGWRYPVLLNQLPAASSLGCCSQKGHSVSLWSVHILNYTRLELHFYMVCSSTDLAGEASI